MQNLVIFRYSRTKMNDKERNTIRRTLTCIIDRRFVVIFQRNTVTRRCLICRLIHKLSD
ncbi:hypothetical protein ACP275_14G080400 [Erythranthe tilingii]